MSILANLLKKNEGPQNPGQIPPGLLKSMASGGRGRVQRRTYLLVAAGVVTAVVGGFLLVLYLQNRPTVQPEPARQPVPVAQVPAQPAAILQDISTSIVAPEPPVTPEAKPPVIAAKRAARPVPTKAAGSHGASVSKPRSSSVSKTVAARERTAPQKDRSTIHAYLFAARSAEARRDHQQALKLYRQALGADPFNYHIMNNLASSLLRLGQYDEALLFVIRALTLKEDYVSALVNGGIAHSGRGDNAAAGSMFNRAASLEPANKEALYNLALSQEKSMQREEALTSFRRLADLGDVKGYFGMARIQEGKGNRGEAVRIYREITGMSNVDDTARNVARKRISALE